MSAAASARRSHEAKGARHWQAGRDHLMRRDWAAAARAFEKATRATPGDALYWLNLANARRRAGAFEAAEAAARQLLALEPAHALGQQVLADVLASQHRYAESAAVFTALEAAGTQDPESMARHASMLLALCRPREALDVLMRALGVNPGVVAVHILMADAFRDQLLKREAVECLKTVRALQPDNLEALSQLSFEKRFIADWSELDADIETIARGLSESPQQRPRVVAAFGTLSLPLPAALQRVAAAQESAAFQLGARLLPRLDAAARARRVARARVRVGFVSYDFREHPVSQLLVEVLEQIDRSRFEVVLYSSGPDDGTPLRARIAAAADRFVDIRGQSDAEAAARVRADEIDLLLDLAGHTRGHRLGLFAARPAPLQLGYLGYPGTTGASFIDYFVGDAISAPLAHEAHFSERIVQLPGCFQPNGRWRPLPQPMTRAEAGLPEDAFVMCTFNHTYKIGPQAFDAWCRVMRRVPRAVLWIRESNGQLHDNVRREAALRGIAPERIVFAPHVPYDVHFSRLALADVFVDTWPYNAHTTAADALWAGVPVLTLPGESFASRVAASILAAVGLEDLAMRSIEDYEAALVTMATDPEVLPGLRAHLVDNRLQLPLFDTPAYTRRFEAALAAVWRRWCEGLPPQHVSAEELAATMTQSPIGQPA
jgi:predicted O-linked N-acetylglucosamine transferase (SPINDLY family)